MYSDDTFRGTNQPAYASGNYDATGGFTGGGLRVLVGGIDAALILGMSGGWDGDFVVIEDGTVSITLRYSLFIANGYESGECGQALVSVDGVLVSPGPSDFLEEFCGATPNLPTGQDSGWQQVSIDLNLTAGTHVITVGGYNNKKNAKFGEFTEVRFDDIEIVQQVTPPGQETNCTDGIDNDGDTFTDCTDTDCASAPNCNPEAICNDSVDNDGDGQTDCTDTDCASDPNCSQATIFSDDFNDGNANGWTVVNDAGKVSNWQVVSGEYNQLNTNVAKFTNSFHLGSYSYYSSGFSLTNYEVSASIRPLAGTSVGLMFRYQDSDNYYRFSMSRDQGFTRLESKVNGVFKTLGVDGRGPTLNQLYAIKIVVNGPKILVYLNGEPLFSTTDSSLSSGTIALYTQGNVKFDNVLIKENSLTPKVVIFKSTSYFVETSSTLVASAIAMNVPSGDGVKFVLDNGASSFTDFTEDYFVQFTNVSQGNHTITASIVDSSGTPISGSLAQDTNVSIGVGGKCFVAMGDSITNGQEDDFPNDNDSVDGRNLGRGYEPILNDLLSGSLNKPITVMNEGLGGSKSGTGTASGTGRVNSTKNRHTESQYWLILFGTNDSGGSMPIPSGMGLQPGDPGYTGSFKDSMQKIIANLQSSGKIPLLAKVPFIINATTSRDQLIQDYNVVVDQLVTEHNIPVTPPDLYNYFKNHQNEFADNRHPNGNGYISIANLWFNAITQSGILN